MVSLQSDAAEDFFQPLRLGRSVAHAEIERIAECFADRETLMRDAKLRREGKLALQFRALGHRFTCVGNRTLAGQNAKDRFD